MSDEDNESGLPEAWVKEQDDEAVSNDLRQQLLEMTVPQKIKLAMFGNSVARRLLISDSNKTIVEFVLKNPRLGLNEIESFLKSTTLSDHVIRLIAANPEYMKPYLHKVLLVSNPKTPQDISLKWLRYLNETELKKLSKSKNVPQLVAQGAGRLVRD